MKNTENSTLRKENESLLNKITNSELEMENILEEKMEKDLEMEAKNANIKSLDEELNMIKKEKDKTTKQLKDRENEIDIFQSQGNKIPNNINLSNDDKSDK